MMRKSNQIIRKNYHCNCNISQLVRKSVKYHCNCHISQLVRMSVIVLYLYYCTIYFIFSRFLFLKLN